MQINRNLVITIINSITLAHTIIILFITYLELITMENFRAKYLIFLNDF